MKDNDWNNIYSSIKKSYKELPWIRTNVPFWFKEVIDSNWIKPCKTLDLGCGNGYYSNYLSKKGFDVTGIDISKKIIDFANQSYKNKNLRFKHLDIFSKKYFINEKFNFLLDVGLFHNILPERRKEYAKILYDLLEDKGKLLIFCFDRREETFKNKEIYLNTKINMTSYPLLKKEIIDTFSNFFVIENIKEISYGTDNYKKRFLCFFEKK